MRGEIFQSEDTLDLQGLEMQLALQCAPLLMGIKISNLLIVNSDCEHAVRSIFDKTSISQYILHKSDEKIVFLLYHKEYLQEYMSRQDVNRLMLQYGYKRQELSKVLKILSARYCYYMNNKRAFPRELGLILGYPADDVKGFIENEGKKYLYIGYWKVYSNLQKTIEVFETYNYAKRLLVQLIKQGTSIRSVIERYQMENIKVAI